MDYINIVQWNAQSLLCNRHIFTQFLYENDIHIAIISETWLKPEQKLNIRGYKIERKDIGSNHNGVALIIRNSIPYTKIDTFCDNAHQNICITIKLYNQEISFISFYSPPTANFNKNKLDLLIKNTPKPFILGGDFNANYTAWGSNNINCRGRNLLDIIDDNNLVLLNSGEPTTVGSLTWRPNALDLSLVSPSLALACDWSVHDDPMGSYHLPVNIKILINRNKDADTNNNINLPKLPNYKLINWDIFQKVVQDLLLDFRVDKEFPLNSYNNFIEILHKAVQKSIPYHRKPHNITVNNRRKRLCLPWWNSKCSVAVQNCKQAYLVFKYDPSIENYINFKRLQELKKLTLKQERESSWNELCHSFNRNTPITYMVIYEKI